MGSGTSASLRTQSERCLTDLGTELVAHLAKVADDRLVDRIGAFLGRHARQFGSGDRRLSHEANLSLTRCTAATRPRAV